MKNLRSAVMRRRVCPGCENHFVPKRIDAETCSPRCRVTVHRRKDAKARAESLFRTQEQIARNVADEAVMLEYFQDKAGMQNDQAETCGIRIIRFIGTRKGVLAVHSKRADSWTDGLPAEVLPWKPQPFVLFKELQHDPENPEAGDPEVTLAVVDALTRQSLGVSYRRRQQEEECRALLNGPVRRLALFVEDPEWRTKVSHPRLPSSWGWDDDLEEPDGRLAGHSTWSGVDPWSRDDSRWRLHHF